MQDKDRELFQAFRRIQHQCQCSGQFQADPALYVRFGIAHGVSGQVHFCTVAPEAPLTLVMDKAHWKLGKSNINIDRVVNFMFCNTNFCNPFFFPKKVKMTSLKSYHDEPLF